MGPFVRLRLPTLAIAACLLALGLAGLAGPAARAATGLEGVPHFQHIVVVTEENENESATFGPGSPATYLNSLVSQGVFLPNYFGTGHVSLDNYLAMVSGQPSNGVSNTDCLTVSLWTCAQAASLYNGGTNLGDQLDAKGISWNSWMDGTPTPCFHAAYTAGDVQPDPYQGDSIQGPPTAAYNYADRHNPFIYFTDFIGNQARCAAHQLPFDDLSAALASSSTWTDSTLPAFSFITPDTCHDGHDNPCADGSVGGLVSMDQWLQANLPSLLAYLYSHDGLLVINFDEGNPISPQPAACTSCAGGGAGGQTGALLLGARIAQGVTVTTGYDHYSLLRTIEDSLGISSYLGLAALAQPMAAAVQWAGPRHR